MVCLMVFIVHSAFKILNPCSSYLITSLLLLLQPSKSSFFFITIYTAGNTNGIYKGKRYFDCSPRHGRMLHITNVLAAMPRQVGIEQYTCSQSA